MGRIRAAIVFAGLVVAATVAPSGAAPSRCLGLGRVDGQCESWQSIYDKPATYGQLLSGMDASPSGDHVYVTGLVLGGGTGRYPDQSAGTVAFDGATGRPLWRATFTAGGTLSSGESVVASPDERTVYVTGGASLPGDEVFTFATVAHRASDGGLLWQRLHPAGAGRLSYAWSIAVARDGSRVFASGWVQGAAGDTDFLTVAYDGATGAEVWSTTWAATADDDQVTAMAVSPDGARVIVTGMHGIFDGYETIAYDATTGRRLWVDTYRSPAQFRNDIPTALAFSPDGRRAFITGLATYAETTIAYDVATGSRAWTVRRPPAMLPDQWVRGGTALAVAPDGTRVYVAGIEGLGYGNLVDFDYRTTAYEAATGKTIWTAKTGLPANEDAPNSVALSPDGTTLYETGFSSLVGAVDGGHLYSNHGGIPCATFQADGLTVAYETRSGRRLWTARLHHSDCAEFAMARATRDGVVVAGTTMGPGNRSYDYILASYPAEPNCTTGLCPS